MGQLPVSKPLRNGSDVELFERCLKSKKIFECNEDQIKDVLKYVMLLVGIRAKTVSLFEDEEKKVLIMFLRRNYAGHTIDEIKLAFDKAIIGELGLEAKEIKPYENFSCEYIGRIMSAYRKWAGDTYRESGIETRNYMQDNLLPPANFNRIEIVDLFYRDFLEDKLNIALVTELAWDIVTEEFKVRFTDEDMLSIVKEAREYYLHDYEERSGDYHKAKSLKYELNKMQVGESCNDNNVNRRSKALALRKWFSHIKDKGVLSVVEYHKTITNEKEVQQV